MYRFITLTVISLVGFLFLSVAGEQHVLTKGDVLPLFDDSLGLENRTELPAPLKISNYLYDSTTWILTAVFLAVYYIFKVLTAGEDEIPEGKKGIPIVRGGLPFIGHGLFLFRDVLGFVNDCYKKYGGIFCVKFFRTKIVIICDQSMATRYFKEQENNLSLEHELRTLNFDWPFYEREFGLRNAINFFRKSIAVRYDDMIPKIEEEARGVISRLRKECQSRTDGIYKCAIEDEAYRFIARTSHACFISGELKDIVLAQMRKFFGFVNILVLSSYFVPNKWTKFLVNWRVRQLRNALTHYFEKEVEPYRSDPDKGDSMLIRTAVDFEDKYEGKLTNRDIADLMVGFMFVSTENTSVGLANAVSFMVMPENAQMLEKLREECAENIHDTKELLKAPILNACVMEMARMSAHLFAIQRKPMKVSTSLGEFYIGKDVDSVALSGQMVMVHGNAEQRYKQPMEFNPSRFLGKTKEPIHSPNIVTWGGGLHLCPGRLFALYEIKVALAHLILNFDFKLDSNSPPTEFDYFSPIAFAKRNINLRLSIRNQNNNNNNEE